VLVTRIGTLVLHLKITRLGPHALVATHLPPVRAAVGTRASVQMTERLCLSCSVILQKNDHALQENVEYALQENVESTTAKAIVDKG
jgi:hypothetical protein